MTNVISFPTDFTEFDAMSHNQRLFMIKQFNEDMQCELDRITDAAAQIKELLAANEKWKLERE